MRGNLTNFFKDYFEHWGELNIVIDTLGDSGRTITALTDYAAETDDINKEALTKALGRLYISTNILIESLGREKVMGYAMSYADHLDKEMNKDKTEKEEAPEWDALDRLKEKVEDGELDEVKEEDFS